MPSLIFEIFPFIFLITVKAFYLNLNDRNEIDILNSNGISNLKIVFLLMLLSLLLVLFIVILLFFLIKSKKQIFRFKK